MSIDLKENESYLVEEILPENNKKRIYEIYKTFEDLANDVNYIFNISRPVKIFKVNNENEIIEELSVAEIYNIIEPFLHNSHYRYLINNINLNYFATLGNLEEKLFLAKQGLCIEVLIMDENQEIRNYANKYITEESFFNFNLETKLKLAKKGMFPNLISKDENEELKKICLLNASSMKSCNYFFNDKNLMIRLLAEKRKNEIGGKNK